MSKRPLLVVAVFSFALGLAGVSRADAPAPTAAQPAPSAPAGECPHMKAMREAQKAGEANSDECPHMKAMREGKGGECPHMKDGKGGECPHMKDGAACPHAKGECPCQTEGKPCACPHCKGEAGAGPCPCAGHHVGEKGGKDPGQAGVRPAKQGKGKRGPKAPPAADAKAAQP